MSIADQYPPALSADVVVSEPDAQGRRVFKNSRKNKYIQTGEQESFLLLMFDNSATYAEIARAYEARFEEPITCEEINEFVDLARSKRLVSRRTSSGDESREVKTGFFAWVARTIKKARRTNPFFFRVSFFDPDWLLNIMEPRTRWLFSWQLVAGSGVLGIVAAIIVWSNRADMVAQFTSVFGWETFVLAWVVSILATICHEFGHGLACKRYGGEVREMGALWILFTPCFFCNVSDAWLFPSRWRRIVVSLAGTYIDFLIWIIAVFVWRLSAPHTAINFMAWVIVTTCGVRVLFNINPLQRLDGYYALADFLGVHNLRRRGRARLMEYARWLLWGAKRPEPVEDGRTLLIYGAMSWVFTVGFLNLLFFSLAGWLKSMVGLTGVIAAGVLFLHLSKRYFIGGIGDEFMIMLRTRWGRVACWAAAIVGFLCIPWYDRAGGPFQLRPTQRVDVRAPVAGFLTEVHFQEGEHVSAGDKIATLEITGLKSEISRKIAEITEVEAKLKSLTSGTRIEEINTQKERVQRMLKWRDLGVRDLERAKTVLAEELAQHDLRIQEAKAHAEFRTKFYENALKLYEQGGLAGQQLMAERMSKQEADSAWRQVEAAKRVRIAQGVTTFEETLARREKELADAEATLFLLEAGNRPETIEAEQARLARLQEELNYFQAQQQKQVIYAPIDGIITTARMNEKIGLYLDKGISVCVVEDTREMQAEIALAEHDARALSPGYPVTLQPRSMPNYNLYGKVDRVGAAASTGVVDPANPPKASTPRNVIVYCKVENEHDMLRAGATGYGRVSCGLRPVGWIMFNSALRLLRTEFWW